MSSGNDQDRGRDVDDTGDVDCNRLEMTSSNPVAVDGVLGEAVGTADTTPTPPDIKKKKHKKRKESKGRLKKLWRRAVGSPPGIISRSEWLELMELHSSWKLGRNTDNNEGKGVSGGGGVATDNEAMMGPLPGPSVSLATQQPQRDFAQLENWQTTEGSDHRDVLVNLLFGKGVGVAAGNSDAHPNSTTKQKKKRRKLGPSQEEGGGDRAIQSSSSSINIPPLPSWSNISNLGSVGGVAVIEIQINGDGKREDETCPLMPSQRIMDSVSAKSANVWSSLLQHPIASDGPICGSNDDGGKVKRVIGAACKVKLFQGKTQPRSLSDVLMFLPPPPVEADKTKRNGCFDVFEAMNDLLLKPRQIRSEGFPIAAEIPAGLASTNSTDRKIDRKLAIERICKLNGTMPTGVDALELVSTLSVNAVFSDTTPAGNEADREDDFSTSEHYVKTFSHEPSAGDLSNGGGQILRRGKIFALDCEMVDTSAGSELARVSVIMFEGGNNGATKEENSVVVMDELVKPRRDVLDYLTEYSGITPKMLLGTDTRIEQIQVRLLSIIDREHDILVGHSLENDLRALRLVHNRIIDTSVIFRGTNGRKFSLRHLSNVLLQKKIQQGCGSTGHCSTEDASAALVLALRRARRGESFRLKENSRRHNILSVFQKANRESRKSDDAESFVERNDGSCVCIGPNDDWISKYAQTADGAHHVLSCDSIMNSMSMAVPSWLSSDKSSKRAGLLWANLRCENRGAGGKGQWQGELKKLDEMVKALVDRVPHQIPIVMLFQRNYEKALALTKQRKAAHNPKSTSGYLWTSVQEEEWDKSINECRYCEAIWIGSTCSSLRS